MEIFRNTNFDFLGKKWPFIIASLVLTVAGIGSIVAKGGLRYGIDFRGGALMTVKWATNPPEDKIRAALAKKITGEVTVQPFTDLSVKNEVAISTEITNEKELNSNLRAMQEVLEQTFGHPQSGKKDFNNAGTEEIVSGLREPLQQSGAQLSDQQLRQLVADILAFRDSPPRSGLLAGFDQLSGVAGVNSGIINALKQQFYLSPFHVADRALVGPKVGAELRKKAVLATLYALGGMLVYIAFRFEWIYGVAAVVAVFHDTIITIGLFSLFNKEISLTVIAALLTLVGYSMNDTIVIFDRIRENLKILRREPLESLINKSINQTLSRTIMTSGLTFLTVIALFLFGGPVLHGFSFALVAGIIVGTYSSVFIASPIVLFWHNFVDSRRQSAPAPAPVVKSQPARKSPTRAAK
ncbi:MAG TPA: protein translocase subunit SecF [Bryobacteraceae bacterium]|jgi:preprotein translocase subunit SecF|nr:protein translocase subunit SecF [Bryobacteraceae bacterium]